MVHDKVDQMERPTRLQYTRHLPQHLLAFVFFQMMKHERGENAVKRTISIRKFICEGLIELHRNRSARGFSPRAPQCLRIRIEADDIDGRILSFQHHDKRARSTANVENAFASAEISARDQFLPCTIETHQADERIVQWQK